MFTHTKLTKFQYVSNLRIDTTKDTSGIDILSIIEPIANILIISGNVGIIDCYDNYQHFMSRLCEHFEKVILVPGELEYYNITDSTIEDTFQKFKQLDNDIDNLILLNDSYVDIEDTRVYGTTFWKPASSIDKFMYLPIKNSKHVIIGNREWMNSMYENSYAKLKEVLLDKTHSKKMLIVSHHGPHSRDYYGASNIKTYWNSFYLYKYHNHIDVWVHGDQKCAEIDCTNDVHWHEKYMDLRIYKSTSLKNKTITI